MPRFKTADLIAVGHYREMHASPKVHREGPSIAGFIADQPHEDEGRILAYLHAGFRYGGSDYAEFDVLDPRSGTLVALGDKTDGIYTWPVGLAYYVEKYHVRISEDFLRHMAAAGWAVPVVLNAEGDEITPNPSVMHLDLSFPPDASEPYVVFDVDGVDLGGRIKEAFGADEFDECLPWYGTDYSIAETVFGPEARLKGRKCALLLACNCGCQGCSGVTADVQVTETMVIWSGFRAWRPGRSIVAALDPVVFDRTQFEEAVTRLIVEVEDWRVPSDNTGTVVEEIKPLLALPKPEP